METVLKECTTEEQRSVVRFLWANRLNPNNIHKESFPFTVGSVRHIKWFTTQSRNSPKDVRKLQTLKWR
jgi:hypothetical protein